MTQQAIFANRKLRMSGPLPETKAFIKAARVVEGLSQITEMTIDFMAHDRDAKLADIVGQPHTVKILKNDNLENPEWREFRGTCVEASYLGVHEGFSFFTLEVRPWIWFLTKTANNRIFQNLNAIDIIKKIFADRGFTDYSVSISRTPEVRVYTVQYNETDYAFICRLMEEEGIYFFSTVRSDKDHLVIADGAGSHSPVTGMASIPYADRETEYRKTNSHIFEWRSAESVRGGKVTLRDYDFEAPSAQRAVVKAIAVGSHGHKTYEDYRYPGHFRQTALGDHFVKVRMEAESCAYETGYAVSDVATLATGATFTLTDHPRDTLENAEYLITSAVHLMQVEVDQSDESQAMQAMPAAPSTTPQRVELPSSIKFDEENKDTYRCTFRMIKKAKQFRAPIRTPWPSIPGLLIAKVVGPAGEEIYTDKYGRIKVQFPWDREGKNNETSGCWIRYVTQWSGKDWGLIAIPRIGQEVVIQFEDGDIDRPICTGMLYNAETMPPNALAANMTQTGIKTRSSKGGGAANYNELVFEDKKDAEFIRMHSEKDYFLTVENDMVVSIGQTKKNPGDLTTDIHHSRTETIHQGDLTLTVKTGNEARDIKTNRSEKIGGDALQEIKGNKTRKVGGNFEQETTGNSKNTVTGSLTEEVTQTISVKGTGGITIESPASIELKVGGNSIKIDPSGITIKGIMITTDASGMATHKAGGIMTIQGSMVMIN